MHARMRGAKLPLPVDFTPPNADTTAQWKRLAVHTKDQLVKLSRLRGGRVRWTRYSDKHGVQVYRGADEEAPPGLHTWCAVTEVQATIDEVDNLFRSDASRSVGFIESALLFDRNVLDATIVHTLEDTPAASLGVQWLLTRPMGTFSSLRDWCLLTYTMATTVQGRRGWVRAYTSVDVDSCRPSANDRDDAGGRGGYVRGHHLCSGYVVMESTTKPGFLHVRLAMQCTFHAKDAASIKALAAKCQHLAALDLRLRSCRLSSNQPSNVKSMPLGVPATACGHCNKLFRLFTIKTTCQKCNQVYCRVCCPQWRVMPQSIGPASTLRACLPCSLMSSIKPARLSFTGSRRTEMDVIEVESTDVDVSRDDAALGALFNDIKQRCSMVLAEVDPQSRVTKADAASLWPQPLHSHPFQRLSQFTEPLSQFVEPSLLQFEPHVVQVQHSSHSAKGRRTSSVHKQATDRRRRHSTLIMHDGSSDDGGSYMRPATRTLLEDDDMARQIYQNRQSVLQII